MTQLHSANHAPAITPAMAHTFTSLPGDRAHPIHVGDHAGMSSGALPSLQLEYTEIIYERS